MKYEIIHSIRQEALKEAAAAVFNMLVGYMCKQGLSEDDDTPYAKLFWEISKFKKGIISDANYDEAILNRISAQIKDYRQRVNVLIEGY